MSLNNSLNKSLNNKEVKVDLLLKNGTLVVPQTSQNSNSWTDRDCRSYLKLEKADIALHEGKIVAIGDLGQMQAHEIISCEGLHIAPGLIDTQVHFRDPGLTHKEDMQTGSMAALLGGITGFFDMPNTNPVTTSQKALDEKIAIAKKKCHTNYAFYFGVEPETIQNLSELEKFPNSPGIKVFLGLSTGHLLIRTDEDIAKIFKATKSRIAFHSEDDYVLESRKTEIKPNDPSSHPVWRNAQSAFSSTQRILKLCHTHHHQAHILHVSTQEEMEFLKNEREHATVEILPQHLLLQAPECYEKYKTFAQQNPPIRSQRHREAIQKALQLGIVDVMASDHAPHTMEEKNKTYPQSPSGMPGVQTLVPLMLDQVNKGLISLPHFVALMTESPRRIFKIKNKARLEVGYDADLTIIDLKAERIIEKSWLASKCGWSPFEGQQVQGWIKGVILGGKKALWEDEVLLENHGRPMEFEKSFIP